MKKRDGKFLVAGLLLLGLVGYLMATGLKDSLVYYHTPSELLARVRADPSYHQVGVKVGARVVPGSVRFQSRTLDLHFLAADIAHPEVRFPVHYQGPLPDTFEEGRDVVLEGRYTAEGRFEATTLLTKCGSRYEAVSEAAGEGARPS